MPQVTGIPSGSAWRYTASRRAFLLGLGAAGIGSLLGRGPVRAAEATPASDAQTEPLIQTTFAENELPAEGAECLFYRVTLEPGVATSVLAGPYCGCPGQTLASGVGVEVVVSGSYAVQTDGAVRVRRASSMEEKRVTGGEVTLGPGDVAVYADYAASGTFRNAGSDELVVLGVAILATHQPSGTPVPELPDGVRARELTRSFSSMWEKLPDGPKTIDLRRLTLASGEEALIPVSAGLDAMSIESGDITFSEIPAGQEAPTSPPMRYGPGGQSPLLMRETGSRLMLENRGDQPAAVLLLSIVPYDASATPTSTFALESRGA